MRLERQLVLRAWPTGCCLRDEGCPGRVAFCAGLRHELLKNKKRSPENAEAKADGHHDSQAIPKQDGQRRR